ncbi:hypothetical protein [Enterocloster clostridioformis]|nr:hypothetical protein [Enterocloster clostridioformis]GEA35147.1 hypothetical protein Ccl03g_08600 [Enterocloster clostridioformis]
MRDWLDSIDARNQKQAKYNKNNTVGFYMKLNIHTDADIIRWLQSQPSKQGAIKRLIRDEIAHKASEKLLFIGMIIKSISWTLPVIWIF